MRGILLYLGNPLSMVNLKNASLPGSLGSKGQGFDTLLCLQIRNGPLLFPAETTPKISCSKVDAQLV